MLSVIIATRDSERALMRTLSALVPGALDGLVREVIVADGGSGDETAAVADVAGCTFMPGEASLARRLNAAAATARASWLMFLRPGTVPQSGWIGEVRQFTEQSSGLERVAVFRPGHFMPSPVAAAMALLKAALGAPPRPEQGLLIGREFYVALGGCADTAADAETDLLRRIGRRRIVMLGCGATIAR
jgi:glycosyltransferase involved in cell wall biosynthesis